MDPAVASPGPPATTIDDVIARMRAIDGTLPTGDGVACFNRMYLEVTLGVAALLAPQASLGHSLAPQASLGHSLAPQASLGDQVAPQASLGDQVAQQGTFGDPGWVSSLDVVFANRYFAAVDSLSGPESAQPVAWRPLLAARGNRAIEPIQFALAGMNIHINHDLPLAVVATCIDLDTTPTDSPHHDDYQRIDKLLDATEQSVRESFEPADIRLADHHVAAVTNLVCNWSVNEARDVAWDTALAIWAVREHRVATDLLTDSLARLVAMGTSTLLVAV